MVQALRTGARSGLHPPLEIAERKSPSNWNTSRSAERLVWLLLSCLARSQASRLKRICAASNSSWRRERSLPLQVNRREGRGAGPLSSHPPHEAESMKSGGAIITKTFSSKPGPVLHKDNQSQSRQAVGQKGRTVFLPTPRE